MNTSEESLSAALMAALGGDDLRYRAFLSAVAPLCRGIIKAKAGGLSAEDQEDILQDILMAIHSKRHTWRTDAPVRPWLFAITRYKIIDAFRKRGQKQFVDVNDLADVLPADDEGLSDAMDVEKLVGNLQGKQGDVVRAIGLEERSITDVAQMLKMTENAVRVNFHRGLEKLRKMGGEMK